MTHDAGFAKARESRALTNRKMLCRSYPSAPGGGAVYLDGGSGLHGFYCHNSE